MPMPLALNTLERTAVMGICNLTDDSFSDGGLYLTLDRALEHCRRMTAEGADIIDVGGESTRPGAERVPAEIERQRVLPLVKELVSAGIAVSVDTTRSQLALACVEAGALMINDVSGGLADQAMLEVMAETGVVSCLMHWRGPSKLMDRLDDYSDVLRQVIDELSQRVDSALAAGVKPTAIVLDPGLGFSKTGASNWPLLSGLNQLAALGFPLLVGASRKRFLQMAEPTTATDQKPPFADRDAATVAVSAIAAMAGVWCVRVHEVAANATAVRVAAAVNQSAQICRLRQTGLP
jgi:dihydropteroate synthase